jgi:uncharacterized iron-regulated protein
MVNTLHTIPEIRITTSDQQLLANIKSSIVQCCSNKKLSSEEINHIAEFKNDGITLKLNHAEGMFLFDGDKLLYRELGLFNGNPTNTKAYQQEKNGANAAQGLKMELPSLREDFLTLAKEAEQHMANVTPLDPPKGNTIGQISANNPIKIVGEIHEQESPKLALEEMILNTKKEKSALLVEGIPANRQYLLDEWQNAPSGTPVPSLIKANLTIASGEEGCKYYERLLHTAKNNGVKVIAFDSDAALAINYSNTRTPDEIEKRFDGKEEAYRKSAAQTMNDSDAGSLPLAEIKRYIREKQQADFDQSAALAKEVGGNRDPLDYRLTTMNYLAAKFIEDCKEAGYTNIMALVGGAHALEENGVPGVGDMVGGAQFAVHDIKKGEAPGSKITSEAPPGIKRGEQLIITLDPNTLRNELDHKKEVGNIVHTIETFLAQSGFEPAKLPEPLPGRPSPTPIVAKSNDQVRTQGH